MKGGIGTEIVESLQKRLMKPRVVPLKRPKDLLRAKTIVPTASEQSEPRRRIVQKRRRRQHLLCHLHQTTAKNQVTSLLGDCFGNFTAQVASIATAKAEGQQEQSIADVENQSVLTNRPRPGRGKTQLSVVLPVSAAGFRARTLVMATSHVAVDVIIVCAFALTHQFPTLLAEKFTDDNVNLQNCWCFLWWSRHNAFARVFRAWDADDTARPPLEVLAGLMAVIQSVTSLQQGGTHKLLSFRVAGARTRALT